MKKVKSRIFSILIALSACLLVYNFLYKNNDFVTLEGEIFSSHYQVTYQPSNSINISPNEIHSAIEKELSRIDWMASSWKIDSEINRYNRAEIKENFPLSNELKSLIEHSKEIENLTGGAFNIEYKKGELDLSGIAKGYAVDRISYYLTNELGIESFLVDIGGEIKASGTNLKGETWNVGVFIPPGYENLVLPKVPLENTAIATSGKYFKGNHITDPKTGTAVTNTLISVSVIHPSGTTADALSTALYVMGATDGLTWARQNKIRAIFILDDATILYSQP